MILDYAIVNIINFNFSSFFHVNLEFIYNKERTAFEFNDSGKEITTTNTLL